MDEERKEERKEQKTECPEGIYTFLFLPRWARKRGPTEKKAADWQDDDGGGRWWLWWSTVEAGCWCLRLNAGAGGRQVDGRSCTGYQQDMGVAWGDEIVIALNGQWWPLGMASSC